MSICLIFRFKLQASSLYKHCLYGWHILTQMCKLTSLRVRRLKLQPQNQAWLKLDNVKLEKPKAWTSQTLCFPSSIFLIGIRFTEDCISTRVAMSLIFSNFNFSSFALSSFEQSPRLDFEVQACSSQPKAKSRLVAPLICTI